MTGWAHKDKAYPDDVVAVAVKNSRNVDEALRYLGVEVNDIHRKWLLVRVGQLGLNTAHWRMN